MTYAKPWHMSHIPHGGSVGQKGGRSEGPGKSGPIQTVPESSVRCRRGISARDRNRCVPSSGPGTSCVVCRTRKVHCDKLEGPASNRATRNKDAGTPKKHWSSRFVNEEAGKDEMGVTELMWAILATQTELSSTFQGIQDELRLQNDIAAMDWFSCSGLTGTE